ncbi:PD-(D/E)XK nuclease superfamily protein [Baaleninema sp.]|uniref:PD-(D/E)XK nuclease superfamily protein n=1 Tax=Baaleninema sp. TaxID=3101197 RepID=UPI003D03C1D7
MARNTGTGAVLESMILPSLYRGKYACETQKIIGTRPGGGRHKIDAVATSLHSRQQFLISLKWQQSGGTAEQKVPFEVICLLDGMRQSSGRYQKAYLVLGGEGWSLREFYVSDGLKEYIDYHPYVRIVTLEKFVALANSSQL